MVNIKTEHPFILPNGERKDNLIKFWAEDETGVRYNVKQIETGLEYYEAVDVYPSPYSYEVGEKVEEETEEGEEEDVI